MRDVSLSDKFDVTEGTIFITGKQALARLPLLQHELDKTRGLRSAGYISGYRGSPLGNLDQELLNIINIPGQTPPAPMRTRFRASLPRSVRSNRPESNALSAGNPRRSRHRPAPGEDPPSQSHADRMCDVHVRIG